MFGAVRVHAPPGHHVDHPLGCAGLTAHPYALVGRVEGWSRGAVRMCAPFVFYVDHPIDRVAFAKHPDDLARRVEGWYLGAIRDGRTAW